MNKVVPIELNDVVIDSKRGVQTYVLNLRENTGTVTLRFTTDSIPDRFVLEYEDVIVIDTGYIGDASYEADLQALGLTIVPTTQEVNVASFVKTSTTSVAYLTVYAPLPNSIWSFIVQNSGVVAATPLLATPSPTPSATITPTRTALPTPTPTCTYVSNIISCGTVTQTGAGVYKYRILPAGYSQGRVTVTYNTFTVPDKFTIEHGTSIITTGYVGDELYNDDLISLGLEKVQGPGTGSISFDINSTDDTILIVNAPLPDTKFEFSVLCPTPTPTRSATPTNTPSFTPSTTQPLTPFATPSKTPTKTPASTPNGTPCPTGTPTYTPTNTYTPTTTLPPGTPGATPSNSQTPSASHTPPWASPVVPDLPPCAPNVIAKLLTCRARISDAVPQSLLVSGFGSGMIYAEVTKLYTNEVGCDCCAAVVPIVEEFPKGSGRYISTSTGIGAGGLQIGFWENTGVPRYIIKPGEFLENFNTQVLRGKDNWDLPFAWKHNPGLTGPTGGPYIEFLRIVDNLTPPRFDGVINYRYFLWVGGVTTAGDGENVRFEGVCSSLAGLGYGVHPWPYIVGAPTFPSWELEGAPYTP